MFVATANSIAVKAVYERRFSLVRTERVRYADYLHDTGLRDGFIRTMLYV